MNKVLFAFFLLSSCDSLRTKKNTTVSESSANSHRINSGQNTDTTYLPYVIDTNRKFNDLKKLLEYKTVKFDEFSLYAKKLEDKEINIAETKFRNDSVLALNENYFALLMKKHIQQSKKDLLALRCLGIIINSPAIDDSEKLNFFNSFPESLRKSPDGIEVFDKLQKYKRNIGIDIRQFSATQVVSFSSGGINFEKLFGFPHKYTIMIFGASWCKPCRYGNMLLKRFIRDIDTSKVRFIDFSMDINEMKWRKSIEEDLPQWECVLLEGNFQSKVALTLKIEGVPKIFLIDKNMKIIAEHFDIQFMLNKLKILDVSI